MIQSPPPWSIVGRSCTVHRRYGIPDFWNSHAALDMGNQRLESRKMSNSLPRKVGTDADDEDHPFSTNPMAFQGMLGRSPARGFHLPS